jgi:hypothetical protein
MLVGWLLDEKFVLVASWMWLSFQLDAMSCLLCYMICPRWLEEFAIACGIYDWKIIIYNFKK